MFQKGCFLIQKQNISQQTTNSQSALVELKIKEMQEGAWEGTVAIIWFQMEYCRDLISKLGKVQRQFFYLPIVTLMGTVSRTVKWRRPLSTGLN